MEANGSDEEHSQEPSEDTFCNYSNAKTQTAISA